MLCLVSALRYLAPTLFKRRSAIIVSWLVLATGFSSGAESAPRQYDVGALIDRVIAGEDFVGHEVTITGIALSSATSGDGLVNIGTVETYESDSYLSFVSVYGSNFSVEKGRRVTLNVKVERAFASELNGRWIVGIETVLLECLSC